MLRQRCHARVLTHIAMTRRVGAALNMFTQLQRARGSVARKDSVMGGRGRRWVRGVIQIQVSGSRLRGGEHAKQQQRYQKLFHGQTVPYIA